MYRLLKISKYLLILICFLMIIGCKTTIKNHNNLPALKQKQDFSSVYTGRKTDVMIPGPPVYIFKYDELDTDHSVGVAIIGGVFMNYYAFAFEKHPVTNIRILGDPKNPDDPRAFHGLPGNAGDSKDWDKIIKGHYHCSPTVAAMVLYYWAKEKGKGNLIKGLPAGVNGQIGLIKKLAEYLDTNDQNNSKHTSDDMGHFGTFGSDQINGIKAYANANGGYNITVSVATFDLAKYKKEIDNNRPVIIAFRNPGSKMGHVVVGYGYDGKKALYKDPWDGRSKKIASKNIKSVKNVGVALNRNYGQLIPLPIEPSLASKSWIDVLMIFIDEQISP